MPGNNFFSYRNIQLRVSGEKVQQYEGFKLSYQSKSCDFSTQSDLGQEYRLRMGKYQ